MKTGDIFRVKPVCPADRVRQTSTMPVPVQSTTAWTAPSATFAIDVGQSTSLAGGPASRRATLRVEVLKEGSQPVYFDLLTPRYPRPALYISQENHYSPFGLSLGGAATNTRPAEAGSQALYNGGSQIEDELLDQESANYSTPYRRYDPTLGRFLGVDPLADKYADQGTGQFAFNDPVNFQDPNGADPWLSQATLDLAKELFDHTSDNGSAYWGADVGASYSDDDATSILKSMGAFNALPGAYEFLLSGGISADLPEFRDGKGNVTEAHRVETNLDVNVVSDKARIDAINKLRDWTTEHKQQILETGSNLIQVYVGFKEIQGAQTLSMVPDPTFLTKVAAIYFAADGIARIGGAAVRTWGVWTDWDNNTDFARAPTNLLGDVGYVANGVANDGFYAGSRTQLLMETAGDFVNGRRQMANGIESLRDVVPVVTPYYGAYTRAKKMQ